MSTLIPFTPRAITEPDRLVEAMTEHWQTTLGNVPSDRLRASWRQAFATFNRKIAEHGGPYAGDWHVLSPKTGTGKSESLKLYAAMTSGIGAPGTLIVVRMIAQADEFVRDINERAGRVVAIARHSDSDSKDLDCLSDYPVLVITHAAFTGRPRKNAELWKKYMAFRNKKRKLVVIDEAVAILDVARLDIDLISKLSGAIPTYAKDKWPDGYAAIKTLEAILEEIHRKAPRDTSLSRVVMTSERRRYLKYFPGKDGPIDSHLDEIGEIRKYMRSDRHRYLLGKRSVDNEAESRQKKVFDKIFSDLEAIYDSFILHWKSGKQNTLNTAIKILPDDNQGCVILDATADTNPLYECMEGETLRVGKHPSITARVYDNATLRCSCGHSVGRNSLTKTKRVKGTLQDPGAKTEAPKLFHELTQEHTRRATTGCPMKKVLVVCHKDAERHLAGFDVPFEYSLAHYGALDGRNDFRDHDSVVIFGLDYRHPADAPAQFMALQPEAQTDGWLHDASKRAFKGYPDIKAAIELGVITSSVIQAVNRIRTRCVVDAEGNCPESYVYMLLPENATGAHVYETLREQMPGIHVMPWKFEGAKKARRSEHEKAFTAFIRSLVPGESHSATDIKKTLGISNSKFKTLAQKMTKETTELGQLMAELKVRYETKKTKRGIVAHVAKR